MAIADGYDNRGTDEYPFGFVYFTDGRRVAYASSHGVVPDVTGGWDDPITPDHVKAAEDYLTEQGVNFR